MNIIANNMYHIPPILLLIFKRPDTTSLVLERLRKIKPPVLFIAADGPRNDSFRERVLTEATRSISLDIDWPCQIRTLFREENLGCRKAVSTAIDWFFEHVNAGIILEDDCLPDPSFMRFADELLCKYEHDERVMVVAGSSFNSCIASGSTDSYSFSIYNYCWGWATWKRAWKHFDNEMTAWPDLKQTDWLHCIGSGSYWFKRYWNNIFSKAYCGEYDSWAYRWTFSCWAQGGLTVVPANNLVENIGFDQEATHMRRGNRLQFKTTAIPFPLHDVNFIVRNTKIETWSNKNIYGIGFYHFLKNLLKTAVKKIIFI